MTKCATVSESNYCGCGSKEEKASDRKPETSSTALDILKEHFARGEIDKTEFEERRQVLAGA